ncbi:MAG TPA: hypothetical protein VE287_05590, partial [Actinopolymorphaceae bacterium]|nr:hypothetical protein [Actinopolymorphaceae bacterium]
MTEPNEPTTPLSRMHFSWQRDPVGPEEPGEPDEELPRPEVAASAPASLHEQVPAYWDDAPAPSQAEAEPASDQLATRLTDPDDLRRTRSRQGRSRQARPLERRSRQQATARADTRANASVGAGKSGGRRGRSRSPKGGFDVPPPGGRFSAGRSSHTAVKVTLVLSACLVAVGIVGYLAFSLGFSTMRANTYHLSGADLARYRLSEFPVEQAGRFAADYARLCLTHKGTPGAADQREAQLSRYASSGTDTTCGWNGEGTQTVTDANWTGESEPI